MIDGTQRGTPDASNPIQVALRLYDAFNTMDPSIVDDVVAVGLVDHNPAPGQSPGPEGLKQRVLTDGDRVVVRSTVHGTQLGMFNTLPPTGRTGGGPCARGPPVPAAPGGRLTLELIRKLIGLEGEG
ncbi:MAG: ester cyclase [Chloroflexota bacterium]|nr:ester cyclase [Chloroflexota bacterium]